MKKILLSFLLLILLLPNCSSYKYQNAVTEISNVEVKFNNGKNIFGKSNMPIEFNQKYIFLKPNGEIRKKYESNDVAVVIFRLPNDTSVYKKMTIDGSVISDNTHNEQFLKLISKGKVNLYFGFNYGFVLSKNKKSKFFQKTNLYYCKRESEKKPILIYYVDNDKNTESILKQIALKYFNSDKKFASLISQEPFNPKLLINYVKSINTEKL